MGATNLLGWLATAVFVGSYFARGNGALRRLQMLGAMLWLVYGVFLGAPPVIAANALVMAAAAWTGRRKPVTSAGTMASFSCPDRPGSGAQ